MLPLVEGGRRLGGLWRGDRRGEPGLQLPWTVRLGLQQSGLPELLMKLRVKRDENKCAGIVSSCDSSCMGPLNLSLAAFLLLTTYRHPNRIGL